MSGFFRGGWYHKNRSIKAINHISEMTMKNTIILILCLLLLCGCSDRNGDIADSESQQESAISIKESVPTASETTQPSIPWLQDLYDFMQRNGLEIDEFAAKLSLGDAVIRLIDFDQNQQEELYLGFYDRTAGAICQIVYGNSGFAEILYEDHQRLQTNDTALLKIIRTESDRVFLRGGSGYYTLTDGSFRRIDETSSVVEQLLYMNYSYGLVFSEECRISEKVYRYIQDHEDGDQKPLTAYNAGNEPEQPAEDKIRQGPYAWADDYAEIVWSKLLDPDIQEGRTKYTDRTQAVGLLDVRLMDAAENGIPDLYIEYAVFEGTVYQQVYTYTDKAELIQENTAEVSDTTAADRFLESQMTLYYLIRQSRNPTEEYKIPEPRSREEAYRLAVDILQTIYGTGTELLESKADSSGSIHYYGLVSAVLADFNGDGEDELFCGYLPKDNAWANTAYQRVFGYEDGKLTVYYAQESCSAGGVDPISSIVKDESGQAYIYWRYEDGLLPDYLYLTDENRFEPAEKRIGDEERYTVFSYVKYFQADRSMDPLRQTEETIAFLQK